MNYKFQESQKDVIRKYEPSVDNKLMRGFWLKCGYRIILYYTKMKQFYSPRKILKRQIFETTLSCGG